jgi:multidrug efflux system outer membrane protein
MPQLQNTSALPRTDGSRNFRTAQANGYAGLVVAASLAAAITLALPGCATPVSVPSVDVPAGFAAGPAAETQPETAWWETFGDPVLTGLVNRAAAENRDVRIAAEHLRAARAGVTVNRSFLAPSVSAVGSASDRSSGYSDAVKQGLPDTGSVSAGLGVQWELDLSGRLRAGAAAAAADALAAEHGVRGVQLMVMSDVASNYFALVGTQRQLEALRTISAAHDETLRLVQARERAGLAAPFDVERAQTDAESARAQIPPLETIAAVSRHRIAVLIGDQAFNAARIDPWGVRPSCLRPGRVSPQHCCNAGPTCLPCWRSSTRPMPAASRPRPSGSRACSWMRRSGARTWS